jgi:PAS domain S-box-containing protein
MVIRNLRIIILVFGILTGLVGWMYHLFNFDINNVDTVISIFLISAICITLFGISFIRIFRRKPAIIAYAFKISIAGWFIMVTALNDFPEDYSYCLIFVVLMLSMMYSGTRGFVVFYMSCFLVLLVSVFFVWAPIIELGTFILLFFAAGVLMYFILKSKEKTQLELEKAQANAHAIFQSAVGFFFFLDKEFNIISFNKFAEEIFLKEMHMELEIGKSIFLYFPPETHESFRITLCKCRDGEVIKNEKKVTFPGGPSVWVENTFIPVYDDNKKFLGISFQTVRINERKEIEEALRESELKFSQMAENITDGFWIGTQDEFLYMNTAFEKIWGRKKEDLMQNPSLLKEAMHPDDLEMLNSKLAKGKRDEFYSDEQYRIILPDGEIRWVWARRFPVFDKGGNVYRRVGIITDITEKKNSEAKLSQQNEFLQTLIDTIPNPVFYKDEKGSYIGCNKSFEINIGGKKEDLIGKSVYDLSPRELADIYAKKDNELFKNPGLQIYESKVKFLDGTAHDVIFHKATFSKNDGSIGGMLGVILDITERKKFESALQLSEKRFKEMADTLPLLVYETDEKGNITYFNKAGFSYTGYTLEDFDKGLTLPMMFPPGEMERAIENANKTMNGITVGTIEYILKKKDGSLYPALINTLPVIMEGKVTGRRGVVMDISEIKKAEDKIKASLKEKEILLREIHHRVKNNLQIISSMLRLQSDYITDPRMIDVFRDAQSRILTMSLVHEKLYKADNFSKINIAEYINELVGNISSSYDFNEEKIKIKINADNLYINIDTLIPLGLIINELLTNCLKHAFAGNNDGLIEIQFNKNADGQFYLSVKDNGIGIAQDMDFENIKSLGLRLVKILADQIGGELEIKNKNGSQFSILFKEVYKS